MYRLLAFYAGMREFRSTVTMRLDDYDLRSAYDRGRDFMHRLTFRYWDRT